MKRVRTISGISLLLLALILALGCGSSGTSDEQKDTNQVQPDTNFQPDTTGQPDLSFGFDSTSDTNLPPQDMNIGGSEFSVKRLQQLESSTVCPPLGQNAEPPLQPLGQVELRDVIVTAAVHKANSAGTLERFYVADRTGGPWSGIAIVMDSGLMTVNVGDVLNLKGELQEAFCFTQIKLQAAGDVTTLQQDQTLPEPAIVNCEEMRDRNIAEAYEGVLVKVFAVTVDKVLANFGQLIMTEGCVIDDDFEPFSTLPQSGSEFNWVVGVVQYSFNEYTIEPRNSSDYSLKDAPVEPMPDAADTVTADVELDTVEADLEADLGSDMTADVEADVAVDAVEDVQPDVAPDVTPDVQPDVEPDLVADVQPDLVADVEPDVEPDLTPDTGPDVQPDTSQQQNQSCNQFNLPLINEVRYDTPSFDDESRTSFIELVGPKNEDVSKSGISRLVHFNGADGSEIWRINLGLQKFGANGILLIIDSNHKYAANSWPVETEVMYLCTKAECDSGASGCTCVKDASDNVVNLSGGAVNSGVVGLQNGDDCLSLVNVTGVFEFDVLCYTGYKNAGSWKESGNNWRGSPDWATITSQSLNGKLPHQKDPDSALGRLDCSDSDNDHLDFGFTWPTPGKLNLSLP